MEKNRIRPIKTGKSFRMSYSRQQEVLEMPNLIEVQKDSYQWFLDEGLKEVFADISPITDFAGHLSLEFVDFTLCKNDIKYTIEECKERDATYAAPLKVKVRLCNKDKDEINEHEIFMGDLPLMTETGTFVINGAERVVVSQLHRSPGVFFGQSTHANGTKLYSARIIPFKGSWIEFATDINNVMYAYIDRKKKLPVTTLLRAIGFESDRDILEIFNLAEEVKVTKANLKKFIGRKLAARVLKTWVEDFVDEDTGEVVSIERNEIIVDRETVLENEHIDAIVDSGAKTILLHKEKQNLADYAIIYNTLQKDPCNSEKEAVLHIYRQLRSSEPPDEATARDVKDRLRT